MEDQTLSPLAFWKKRDCEDLPDDYNSQICAKIGEHGAAIQPTTAFDDSPYFQAVILLSAACSCFFCIFVYRTPELHVHPIQVITAILFVDADYQIASLMQHLICRWHLDVVFIRTVYFEPVTDCSTYDAVMTLFQWSRILMFTNTAISVYLNIVLQVDLVLMIRRPFSSDRTMIKGISLVTLLAIFITSVSLYIVLDQSKQYTALFVCSLALVVSVTLVSIVSVVYACRKLRGSGFSREARSLVLNRHILTTVTYFVSQGYRLMVTISYYNWRNDEEQDDYMDTWWVRMLKVLWATQGFYVPLLRFYEPYFFRVVKQKAKRVCCQKAVSDSAMQEVYDVLTTSRLTMASDGRPSSSHYSLNRDYREECGTITDSEMASFRLSMLAIALQDESQRRLTTRAFQESAVPSEESLPPLYVFLASSLNVELVYIILTGICDFTSVFSQNTSFVTAQINENTSIVTTPEYTALHIREIRMANRKDWSDRRIDEFLEKNRMTWLLGKEQEPAQDASESRISAFGPAEREEEQEFVMRSNVHVTFHQAELFMETFRDYIADFDFISASLNPEANRDQVFKAGEGAGRSGSFFFFSHDRKFIIKTMTSKELKVILKLLPRLCRHFKRNPNSLITKIFGVFTVKSDAQQPVHLMLMENTVQLKKRKSLQYMFDLKGSLVDRRTTGETNPGTTLKDVNFLMVQMSAENNLVDLPRRMKKSLNQIIQSDANFLAENGIMDYSLLIGVEAKSQPDYFYDQTSDRARISNNIEYDIDKLSTSSELVCVKRPLRAQSVDPAEIMAARHYFSGQSNRIFHIAIIDYLQLWDCDKKVERLAKTVFMGKKGALLSAIEPREYARRFKQFCTDHVLKIS